MNVWCVSFITYLYTVRIKFSSHSFHYFIVENLVVQLMCQFEVFGVPTGCVSWNIRKDTCVMQMQYSSAVKFRTDYKGRMLSCSSPSLPPPKKNFRDVPNLAPTVPSISQLAPVFNAFSNCYRTGKPARKIFTSL